MNNTFPTEGNLSGLSRKDFQKDINDKKTDLFILKNKKGMEVAVTNYGCAILSIMVPDKDGKYANVVLSYGTLDALMHGPEPFLSTTIGRYGNRIAKGKFTLYGEEHSLTINNGPNSLHGGPTGFHARVWDAEQLEEGVIRFNYTSADGEEGFPGTLTLDVKYTLTTDSVEICYNAVSDKDTVMNFTNHSYFNLNGTDAGDIKDHIAQIFADKYTPVSPVLIPTGEIASVKGTPFDFTSPKRIGEDIDSGKLPGGYDHNYVLGETKEMRKAAEVYSEKTGRVMTTYTDMPAIQFYISGGLGGETGKGGKEMFKNQGFCLESQFCPDSPNKPQFKPTCVYKAGEKYNFTTVYKFSVK